MDTLIDYDKELKRLINDLYIKRLNNELNIISKIEGKEDRILEINKLLNIK